MRAELQERYGEVEWNELSEDEQSKIEEIAEEKMSEFLAGIDDEAALRFHIDIIQNLQNESVAYEVFTDEDDRIKGFKVYTLLFPVDTSVSIKEFHDAVQSVMSLGVPARSYVRYSYRLAKYEGEGSMIAAGPHSYP